MKRLLIAIAFVPLAAGAQSIYKCKDAAGNLHLSDTVCATGTTGGVVEVRPNVLDGSEGRALAARQDYQRQLEEGRRPAPSGSNPAPSLSSSRECQIATKNAWGSDRKAGQARADVACLGPERAAQVAAERKASRPVLTSCQGNGGNGFNCVSR